MSLLCPYELQSPVAGTWHRPTQSTHPQGSHFQIQAAPLNKRSWHGKPQKRLVIMCVGEPSTLNAWQGWALIVLLCYTLYKQGSPDHQLKAAEKQPAAPSFGTFALMY